MNSSRFLRITLLAGLILLILSASALIFFFLAERSGAKTSRVQDSFYRVLREYDAALLEIFGTEREYDYLNQQLDRLEKNAISVEAWLSVLKRRRSLSLVHAPSLSNYHKSINNALAQYPLSQPIILLACGALVKNTAINRENENRLREWLPLITDFNSTRLGFHVILGDFKNYQTANLFIPDNISCETEEISINLAILKIMRSDFRGAMFDIQMLLNREPSLEHTSNALKFAADYHYDFGDIIRSAELFSLLNDEVSYARQADALYLAGFHDSAISIWKMLSQSDQPLIETSLYNLSVTEPVQAHLYLEKLNSIENISNINARQFGLIRYSRLHEMPRAAFILQSNSNLSPSNFPYIDLEICKRYAREWGLDRQIAQTWMLLDRHSENEDLYKWAAWHFFFQRRFDEIPVFLDRFELQAFASQWVNVYRAIYLMNEGNLEAAENILLSITPDDSFWFANANLGRIYEEYRSPSRALLQYELAASKLQLTQNQKTASRIQQRIARCFISLSRPSEAIRVLLYALDLDPLNISAQLELDRLLY
ncbi:MAG: hypothetical protein FWD26_10610 [Treponema sp.]|nr:hypothetical protein [Treponema sp.]